MTQHEKKQAAADRLEIDGSGARHEQRIQDAIAAFEASVLGREFAGMMVAAYGDDWRSELPLEQKSWLRRAFMGGAAVAMRINAQDLAHGQEDLAAAFGEMLTYRVVVGLTDF